MVKYTPHPGLDMSTNVNKNTNICGMYTQHPENKHISWPTYPCDHESGLRPVLEYNVLGKPVSRSMSHFVKVHSRESRLAVVACLQTIP